MKISVQRKDTIYKLELSADEMEIIGQCLGCFGGDIVYPVYNQIVNALDDNDNRQVWSNKGTKFKVQDDYGNPPRLTDK